MVLFLKVMGKKTVGCKILSREIDILNFQRTVFRRWPGVADLPRHVADYVYIYYIESLSLFALALGGRGFIWYYRNWE